MAVSERITELHLASAISRDTGLLISDSTCPADVRAAYEQTYLNVRFAMLSGPSSTLLISAVDATSSSAALAANMAILAAKDGERVVLVDADPHAPTLDSVYNLPAEVGFTDLIREDSPDVPATLQHAADLPNLLLLGVGAAGPIPGGIGRSPGLSEVLHRLKSVADRVIMIGAPILTHVDSMDLCPLVNGVVIAVTPGQTHRLDARRAREVLDRVRAPLLGVVLTRKIV
ncbi:MAG: Non-specific protein-tyrosine kinase [Chloroflexi bacterium]|nr:Non-specific protein-tyrosine kinase [Chloroflexota bacterium]